MALHSERQPKKLHVDNHSGSHPSIWLHSEKPTTAWIMVIIGTRDWCNLAYQLILKEKPMPRLRRFLPRRVRTRRMLPVDHDGTEAISAV